MPFFYDYYRADTTSGTANTEEVEARFLTVANQPTAYITSLILCPRGSSNIGVIMRLKTMSTPGTVGTAYTLRKRHPNQPNAQTTAFSAPTAGTPDATRVVVTGFNSGIMAGWQALNPDSAIAMQPNGGANGNAELFSIAAGTATRNFEVQIDVAEGPEAEWV